MAINANIEMFQGEDVTIQVSVVDSNGDAVDINGWTLAFAMALTYGASNVLSKAGAVVGDGSAGQFNVVLTDDDLDGLDAAVYRWDVKRTDDGYEAVLTYGNATVKAKVAV